MDVLGDGEGDCLDFLVGLAHLTGLEGWPSVEHGVEDDADGPAVNRVAVATVLVENLRGQIVGSAAHGALLLALVEDLGSQAEVAHFEAHSVRKEQVAQLEVSVDDLARVDVLDGVDELRDVVSGLNLMQALASLDKIREGLVGADVEHDVDVLFVFEVAVEADDVLVVERAMDFDLTGELLARLCPGEVRLGHHLESPGQLLVLLTLDWLNAAHLVALGETAFA